MGLVPVVSQQSTVEQLLKRRVVEPEIVGQEFHAVPEEVELQVRIEPPLGGTVDRLKEGELPVGVVAGGPLVGSISRQGLRAELLDLLRREQSRLSQRSDAQSATTPDRFRVRAIETLR
jgi:hypothetical protein